MKIEKRINELGYKISEVPKPIGSYILYRKTGNLIFISGQVCRIKDEIKYKGKIGSDLTIEEGYEACRIAILNSLAILKSAIGDLDKVKKIINLKGYVNSAPGFVQQPKVVNGASDLLVDLFGERGQHSRCALSMNELPNNACVEVELIVEVEE